MMDRVNEGTLTSNLLKNYALQGEVLDVLTYPNPNLLKISQPVETFDKGLKDLAEDMLCTLYAHPGIGLAAPQVGESIRMFVIDVDYEREEVESGSGELGAVVLRPSIPEFLSIPSLKRKRAIPPTARDA